MLLAAGALLLLSATAVHLPATKVHADNSCSAGCKSAYGNCYKSTQDRARCQAQLQRCLETCIRKRR
jgi:hypothetical protein